MWTHLQVRYRMPVPAGRDLLADLHLRRLTDQEYRPGHPGVARIPFTESLLGLASARLTMAVSEATGQDRTLAGALDAESRQQLRPPTPITLEQEPDGRGRSHPEGFHSSASVRGQPPTRPSQIGQRRKRCRTVADYAEWLLCGPKRLPLPRRANNDGENRGRPKTGLGSDIRSGKVPLRASSKFNGRDFSADVRRMISA